jgi:hypothetical protein
VGETEFAQLCAALAPIKDDYLRKLLRSSNVPLQPMVEGVVSSGFVLCVPCGGDRNLSVAGGSGQAKAVSDEIVLGIQARLRAVSVRSTDGFLV